MLHNKREAGIVKSRQESIWLRTRRHNSVPSPREQDFLFFIVVIGVETSVHLGGCKALLWGAGVEGKWVQRNVGFVQSLKVIWKK